jgi:hypothetical protein
MNLSPRITAWLAHTLIARCIQRPADFIIGGHDRPYLLRWYVLGSKRDRKSADPRRDRTARTLLWMARPYLHCFRRSDDDRALHDHPAASISIALSGSAIEHTIDAGGIHRRRVIRAGQVRLRGARFAHRIEIAPGTQFWTLFIFFRNAREWGFHCPEQGWVHWEQFTAENDPGAIGRGCG